MDDLTKKDKEVVQKVVKNMRDDISEILKKFAYENDGTESFLNGCISDIIGHFMKIVYRLKRFANFKSKIKIIKPGQKVTPSDKKRCDFILVLKKKNIEIVKNNYTDHKGKFNNV